MNFFKIFAFIVIAFHAYTQAAESIDGVYLQEGRATIAENGVVRHVKNAKDCMVIKNKGNYFLIYVRSVQNLGDACYIEGKFSWDGRRGEIFDDDFRTGIAVELREKKIMFVHEDKNLSLCGQKADWSNVVFPLNSRTKIKIKGDRVGESCPAWRK